MSDHPTPIPIEKEDLSDQEQWLVREGIRLLSLGLPPDKAIRELLHLLSELLGLNRGRIVIPDPKTQELRIWIAYGLTQEEIDRGRYDFGEGITGRVIQTGETLIVQDIDDEPSYLARAVKRTTLPQETVSFVALPILVDRKIVGVLGVHRLRSRHRPLSADLQVLKTVTELIGQILKIDQVIEKRTADLRQENRSLREEINQRISVKSNWGIIGEDPQLLAALNQLEKVSSSEATVILLGESGTGKELFARALHLQSPRRDQPFIKVNCAAIPETLVESELFGHEKGAFTNALQLYQGRFEQAHGGTLFLDEIGDLPASVQVKLLRVLQERVIERLGSSKEIPIDVRIVAATHQDLSALVKSGHFRLDLYYRLNVIPIRLPPLRERTGDIKLLVRHFISQLNQTHQHNVVITPDAMSSLVSYPWPGNIRQLYNVCERIVLLARDDLIDESTVDYVLVTEAQGQPLDSIQWTAESKRTPNPLSMPASRTIRPYNAVDHQDRDHIAAVLRAHRGNKSQTAKALNLTLRQLNYRIQRLNIATEK